MQEPTAGADPQATVEGATARRAALPDLALAVCWFGFAHACLLVAALLVARDAELLAATFYHPRLLAAVHLLTLGWISGSILGSLGLVPALALRVRLGRSRGDLVACGGFAAGTAILAAAFWWWQPAGIAAGGVVVVTAAAWVAARVLPPLLRAPVARPAGAAFGAAFGGFLLAAALGIAAAHLRSHPDLPVGPFALLFAHVHVAALGWALPVVVGAGYRLIPMLLPSAMPSRQRLLTALVATAGAPLLLAAGLLAGNAALAAAGATVAVAAIGLVVRDLVWMLRNRRPVPPKRPRPDLPLAHAAAAVLALLAAVGCGMALLAGRAAPGLRAAYGILALLGFFGQLIAGVGQRLLAWLCWLHAYSGSGFAQVPPTPYTLVPRSAQRVALGGWLVAVPALALGAALSAAWLVRAGALALAIGVLAAAAGLLRALGVVRRAAGRQG